MRQVFGGEALICNINRLCKWEMVTPERYVLLQCFAGLSCEIVFSRKRVADCMEVKLRSLSKSEVRRTKKQVAEELSVTQAQLDILVQRYNIHPFWRAEGGDTPEKKLRLIITNSITMDCQSGNPDPMTEAFLQIAGVFSQLELSMIRARVRSGIENARLKGKQIGRKPIGPEDIPDSFFRYYSRFQAGEINLSELARLTQKSRPIVYHYIRVLEGESIGCPMDVLLTSIL